MAPRCAMAAFCAVAALASVSAARAQPRAYRGAHPLDLEGNWHFVEEVHVHDRLPVGTAPFGDVDGVLLFLGDPLAYGYQGTVWTYRGAHPLPGGIQAYCGVSGEHRHPFAPEGAFRQDQNGVYAFVGAMHGGVRTVRPGRVAPPHPVVASSSPPRATPTVVGPYSYGGCRQVRGPNGAMVPAAGCVSPGRGRTAGRGGRSAGSGWGGPAYGRWRGGGAGRARSGPEPASSSPSYFSGQYTHYGTRPLSRTVTPRPPPPRPRPPVRPPQ